MEWCSRHRLRIYLHRQWLGSYEHRHHFTDRSHYPRNHRTGNRKLYRRKWSTENIYLYHNIRRENRPPPSRRSLPISHRFHSEYELLRRKAIISKIPLTFSKKRDNKKHQTNIPESKTNISMTRKQVIYTLKVVCAKHTNEAFIFFLFFPYEYIFQEDPSRSNHCCCRCHEHDISYC